MNEFVDNPRQSPRARVRCSARIVAGGSSLEGETEDVGATGCLVVAPAPLRSPSPLEVVLSSPSVGQALEVRAKVAWASEWPPWRLGLSFVPDSHPLAGQWFARLVVTSPHLERPHPAPARLAMDAFVFLGPPPRLADFSSDELEVLRRVDAGVTIRVLLKRLEAARPVPRGVLFGLLARGALTLSRLGGLATQEWHRIFASHGVTPLVDEAPRSPPDFLPAKLPAPAPATPPRAPLRPPVKVAPPPPVPVSLPVKRAPGRPGRWGTAGTGWRGAGRRRSREAQEAFELGRAELAEGRTRAALALLRQALQLAPGDSEIAGELGKALKR